MTNPPRMPALFVGHGSPLNAVEDNAFTRGWEEIARKIPRPAAILAVSAHWYTAGSRIADTATPRTIHDFYGFPDELYRVAYNAPGAPAVAHTAKDLIIGGVQLDNTWGIDHGTWSVLHKMYPEADIPVCQLSVDRTAGAETHLQIGREIGSLREKGVLIFASGNIVHNLARINWSMAGGLPWADDFDRYIREKITARQYREVVDYKAAGEAANLAFTTPEHFYPLLYALGASTPGDSLEIYNDARTLGSISMTCYLFA